MNRHRSLSYRCKVSACVCLLALVFGFLVPIVAFAQSAIADEQKIATQIDKDRDGMIAMLEKVVNIESPTEDLAGVKAVGAFFRKEFDALGMKTRWIDMPAAQNRAGHLIAETSGKKGKRILIIGHMDTVLRGEKFRREGDKVFGTGIADMKGGIVMIVFALKAMHAAGALKDSQITVLLTGDEEDNCDPISICRGDMIEAAKRSDLVLSFEGTVGNTATVGRRGASSWTIEIDSKTGHSSQIFKPAMGDGGIFEASRILNEFRTQLGGEEYLTFNPSLIVGGTTATAKNAEGNATGKTNVVAAKVVIDGDLRFISEEQKERTRAKMREIVAKNLPGTTAKITFFDSIPAMTPVAGNYDLLKQLDQVSRELGFGPVTALDPGERGAGDIAYISNLLPSLDGIGIGGGGNSHAKGEYATVDRLAELTKRGTVLIYRLTR
ncbi:MAG TPA: M20/M25/M40 family metallo-hydrolase [Pyrinomonadaceae bacterium]|nr:M20/M25/M40 family metallo-hydrolase [Pyrinomonadaceae bacterium]